ncbi:nitrous oxide reductase family maturation protein NosD [Sphingomonas flavalba]|uniref:right-handed parallel beta-helix repeat-containing protein n=1 Tax=Sphingomonas flavalba TaxID=2559804 RepID=UPI0039E09434
MSINTAAELRAALNTAEAGDVIQLGDIVGPVSIGPLSFDPPVTLRGGSFSLTGSPAEYTQLLWLNKVTGLTLDGVQWRGAGERGGQLGWGIRADDCSRLTITGCDLTMLHRGMLLTRCSDVVVTRNHIHAIRSDGINIAQCERVHVLDNVIMDFTPAPGDHPDGAQLWTTGTTRGSRAIRIERNLIAGLAGQFPQGIFISDELALYESDAGHDGITIEGNTIVGSAWHGILVGPGVSRLRVAGNDVVGTTGATINGQRVTPWINLPADAMATGNMAPRYLIGGKDGASAGNEVSTYISQTRADEVVEDWLVRWAERGDAAPQPEPDPEPQPDPVPADPAPVDPPPVVAPAPGIDVAALRASVESLLATAVNARDQTNQAENALGRALYRQDKVIAGAKALLEALG